MILEIKRVNGVSYKASVYFSDGRRVSETFRTKTAAREWERRKIYERDHCSIEETESKANLPFSEFCEKWMKEKAEIKFAISTQAYYRQVLGKHFIPEFKNRPIRGLRFEDMNKLILKLRSQGKGPEGVNRIIGVLRTMFNEAVRWKLLSSNPLNGIQPLKLNVREDVFWTISEIQQFLRANLRQSLYPLYVVALNTGMRRGELGGLQWDRVDFQRSQISVTRTSDRWGVRDTTKSGKRRAVPMNAEVRRVLEPLWKAQNGPFVFSEGEGEPLDIHHIRNRFRRAQKRAGFASMIRFHDLRHTFASQFMMNGGNIYDLQKILGHSAMEMTQRYAHLSPDHLADAISIVSFNGLGGEAVGDDEGVNSTFFAPKILSREMA